jgi:predicted helicase
VTSRPTDSTFVSNKTSEIGYIFPIYVYPNQDSRGSSVGGQSERVENLAPVFREWLDRRFDHHYTPEEILGYIYAVLYAPRYRANHAETLRVDFPYVPFPASAEDFDTLSKLGWALVQAHLLRNLPRKSLAAYHGKGEHEVEAVRYDPKDQAVWINKTQRFKPVPQAVWDFHIGGYQVLDKYLKSRKGRTLSLDEINHVAAVADTLAFTIEQMAKIDEAYGAAFPDRG